MEVGAVRAGHRGVFDDGDRRVVLAERAVAERRRDQELSRGHALRGGGLRLEQGLDAADCDNEGDDAGANQQVPTCDHLKAP